MSYWKYLEHNRLLLFRINTFCTVTSVVYYQKNKNKAQFQNSADCLMDAQHQLFNLEQIFPEQKGLRPRLHCN